MMLSINTSSVAHEDNWSAAVKEPITPHGHTDRLTNQQPVRLSRTEPWLLTNYHACTQVPITPTDSGHSDCPVRSNEPLSALVDCRSQLFSFVTEDGLFQTGASHTTVDHIFDVQRHPYLQYVTKVKFPTGGQDQSELALQSADGSSLVNIPLVPPSPYDVTNTCVLYRTAASDTTSACGTRRHFRRRVANYHQNQRHASQHRAESRPNTLMTKNTRIRASPDSSHSVVIWKNGASRNTASLSPPVRGVTGSTDLRSVNTGTPVGRRATSVGPLIHSTTDAKSAASSEPLHSPSGGESLDLLVSDCMTNEWALTDLNLPNRTLSNPMMHNSQTAVSLKQHPYVPDSNPITPNAASAVRSRSHHQLMPCEPDKPGKTESRAVRSASNSGLCRVHGGTVMGSSGPGLYCHACEWSAPVSSNERTLTVLDRWYQRYYTISRNPDHYAAKMMRSPISVLAPCKAKLHLKIESHDGVIQVLIIEAKGLRSCTDTPCNSFVKVTVVPDKNDCFTQTTSIVESKANPVYNQTITLDLNKSRHARRVMLAVFCQQTSNGDHEFIGGMSFGVSGIHTKKEIYGWYYLLNETMARKKHLKAGSEALPGMNQSHDSGRRDLTAWPTTTPAQITSNPSIRAPLDLPTSIAPVQPATSGHISLNPTPSAMEHPAGGTPEAVSTGAPVLTGALITAQRPQFVSAPIQFHNPAFCAQAPVSPQVSITVPKTNQALNNMQLFRFILTRGPKGFGFTLSGGCPVYVSHVEPNSPAMHGGVQPGDFIVAVDDSNVSRSSTDSVVRIFRMAQNPVCLTVCRPTTVCVKTQSSPRVNGSKTFANLFHRGCLSQVKKSTSNDSIPLDSVEQFTNRIARTPVMPSTLTTPLLYPRIPSTHARVALTQHPVANSPPAYPTLTSLSNSRSLYQLSPGWLTPRTCTPVLPSSKTELRLSDMANGPPTYHHHHFMPTPAQSPTAANAPSAADATAVVNLPPSCSVPNYARTGWNRTCNGADSSVSGQAIAPSPAVMKDPQPTNLCSSSPSPICTPVVTAGIVQSPATRPPTPLSLKTLSPVRGSPLWPLDRPIVECLKYVSHVKPVDFRQHSSRLEHHGCLNLLESNSCSKVDLLMFSDMLLIAQRAPNRYFTVIKDPIYNTKICYVNIPPNALDQLILQYIDESNRKQIVHFQGSNVRDWLTWIQGHMVYNGNWWMGNVPCPVNF